MQAGDRLMLRENCSAQVHLFRGPPGVSKRLGFGEDGLGLRVQGAGLQGFGFMSLGFGAFRV